MSGHASEGGSCLEVYLGRADPMERACPLWRFESEWRGALGPVETAALVLYSRINGVLSQRHPEVAARLLPALLDVEVAEEDAEDFLECLEVAARHAARAECEQLLREREEQERKSRTEGR